MLGCDSNQLTSLDVSSNARLTELYCDRNQLTSLDLSRNPSLAHGFANYQEVTGLPYYRSSGGYAARLTDLPGMTLARVQGIALHINYDYTFDKDAGTIFFPQKPEKHFDYFEYDYSTGNAAVPTMNVAVRMKYSSHLQTLTLPTSATTLSDEAFLNCTALEAVIAPNRVNAIGARAFAGCTNLQELYLSDSVRKIAEDAFVGCDKLTLIAPEGSYALKFAQEHGLRYEAE